MRDNNKSSSKRIVLLGASVGRYWQIDLINRRVNINNFIFEYVHGGSGFDKSKRLHEVLSRISDKPDAIFLKECAAYFPGNLSEYKDLMIKWIKNCEQHDIIPIPTTVVPVTRLHSIKKFFIDIVKRRNPFKFGSPLQNTRNKSILKYNDWIRSYCTQNGLIYLDLEKATRYSENNRFLREDFAKLDGLHINRKAYKYLDEIVTPTLERVKWGN